MSLSQIVLPYQNNTSMGFLEIVSYAASFGRSNTLKLRVRDLGKIARPMIDNLERMLEQLEKNEGSPLGIEEKGESKAQEIQPILPHLRTMLRRGKAILESVNYAVHFVSNENEAKKLCSEHAVIFFKNDQQILQARLVDISKQKDIIITVSAEHMEQCEALEKTLGTNTELVITDKNIQFAEELIQTLMQTSGIDSPIQSFNQFMSSVVSFSQDFPKFIALLEKSSVISLVNKLVKNILPVDKYRIFCKKILIELKPENFEKRLLVEKLAALALLEAYNNGLKLVVLALDKIEIQNNLQPFSLSEKYAVIDGMTIKGLCDEFNDAYRTIMQATGYALKSELYPYKAAIFKQCQGMLEKFPKESNDERLQLQKQRITTRIQALGEIQECPSSIDFYSFAKNFLKNNQKTLKEAVSILSPQTATITQTSKNIIQNLEIQLKEILDEKIYETYFQNKAAAEEKPSWIHQAGNVFNHIKEILKKIETLFNPQLPGNNTLFLSIELMASVVRELTQSTAQLLLELDTLYKNPQLQQIVVLPTLADIDPRGTLKNAFTMAVNGGEVIDSIRIKASSGTWIQEMNEVKDFIEGHAKYNIPDLKLREETIVSYGQITTVVTQLDMLYREFEQVSDDKLTLVKFVISHHSKLLGVLTVLPNILTTINKLSKSQFQSTVSAINAILKQIMLLSDRLEIQFFLKQGCIADHWRNYISLFQLTIMKLGYDFTSRQRYPYFPALNEQREQLRDANTSVAGKHMITARIQSCHTSVEDEKKHDSNGNKTTAIKKIIGSHIEELKRLKNKTNVIQLLTVMHNSVEFANGLEELLQDVRVKNAKEIHLLYEGRTGNILQHLEYIDLRPQDSWHAFEVRLAQLKKQRGITHYYFSKNKSRVLEQRIDACEHLYQLARSHNLRDALLGLSNDERLILQKYDAALITQLKWIDQGTPTEFCNKTIIDAESKNDQMQMVEIKQDFPEKKEHTPLFWNRLVELKFSIFETKTNKTKQALLTKLDEEFQQSRILDDAIKRVKCSMPNEAHLLFEGRTGRAIRAEQNALMTKGTLVLRIDAEINVLKEKRYTHLRFFARMRKSTVDYNINELLALRDDINRSKKMLAKDIIHALSGAGKALMKKYEPDLYKEFCGGKITATIGSSTRMRGASKSIQCC